MSRLTPPLGAVASLRSLYSHHLLLNSRPFFPQPISLLLDFKQFTPIKPLEFTTFSTSHNPPTYQSNNNGGDVSRNERSYSSKRRRVELPEELSRNVVVLKCKSSAKGGKCHVYLVGTVHVSQESCRAVEAVISHLKPQVVFLELCSRRDAILTGPNFEVARTLEVSPGSEFRVAYEEAMKYGGKVILGDRPADADIQEMRKHFPTLAKTVVDERDKYMSAKLLRIASEHSSVVAVIGKGHLAGIKKFWKQPVSTNELNELMTVPSSPTGKIRIAPGIAAAAAAAGVAIIFCTYEKYFTAFILIERNSQSP